MRDKSSGCYSYSTICAQPQRINESSTYRDSVMKALDKAANNSDNVMFSNDSTDGYSCESLWN